MVEQYRDKYVQYHVRRNQFACLGTLFAIYVLPNGMASGWLYPLCRRLAMFQLLRALRVSAAPLGQYAILRAPNVCAIIRTSHSHYCLRLLRARRRNTLVRPPARTHSPRHFQSKFMITRVFTYNFTRFARRARTTTATATTTKTSWPNVIKNFKWIMFYQDGTHLQRHAVCAWVR